MRVFSQQLYSVSTCFSEHDIPRSPVYFGLRGWIVEAIAGRKLWCHRVSKSGNSGWFLVNIGHGQEMNMVIHSRFLSRTGFTVVSTYSYEYYEPSPEAAMAAARRKFPDAEHRHGY